mgnify:CR=1 FL=1
MVSLNPSSKEKYILGERISEPSKQGSHSSPKTQSFEIIASLIMLLPFIPYAVNILEYASQDKLLHLVQTGILGNKILILAVLASAFLMGIILVVPALRHVFSIPVLPMGNLLEVLGLVIAPLVVVEISGSLVKFPIKYTLFMLIS